MKKPVKQAEPAGFEFNGKRYQVNPADVPTLMHPYMPLVGDQDAYNFFERVNKTMIEFTRQFVSFEERPRVNRFTFPEFLPKKYGGFKE